MRKNFAIQVASQAALSCASFSVSLLAIELGAAAWHVGLIGAAYGLAQFASSYTFGRAADVYGRRRLVQVGLLLSTLAVLAHALATGPWTLLAARATFGVAAGIFPAALTSLAYDENRKLGKFSSFGALGFSLGVLAGGIVGAVAHEAVFYASGALLALAFGVSLAMSYPPDHKVEVPVFPREVISRNLPAYSAVVLRHAGAAAAWCIFPLYLHSLGAGLLEIGVVNAVNGVCQFAFMARMDRGKPAHLVAFGLVGSAATFAVFLVAPNLRWILAAQPLLAASWAALYMGALRLVLDRSVERATATGLLQSSIHLSNVVGPLVGGFVAFAWGFPAALALGVAGGLVAIPVFYYELARHPDAPAAPPAPGVALDAPGLVTQQRD